MTKTVHVWKSPGTGIYHILWMMEAGVPVEMSQDEVDFHTKALSLYFKSQQRLGKIYENVDEDGTFVI